MARNFGIWNLRTLESRHEFIKKGCVALSCEIAKLFHVFVKASLVNHLHLAEDKERKGTSEKEAEHRAAAGDAVENVRKMQDSTPHNYVRINGNSP